MSGRLELSSDEDTQCFNCTTTDDLGAIAYRRHENDAIVGVFMACQLCMAAVKNKDLFVEVNTMLNGEPVSS